MAKVTRLPDEGEARASIEDPQVPISSAQIIDFLNLGGQSASGVSVTVDKALGIPAIGSAVNFLSGTIAGLPLNVYRKRGDSRQKLKTRLANLLHYNVNEEMSSFAWRKYMFERVFTQGRAYTLIVRGEREEFRYLWPLETSKTKVKISSTGAKTYEVSSGPMKGAYPARDVIDISWMMKENMVDHYSPILHNKDVIGLGIAATNYGSRLFQNGGVPPFIIVGNFQSVGALNRASEDLKAAVQRASGEGKPAIAVPSDHEIKNLGIDPEKFQLVETKRFLLEEYARIYSLPPTFLQDLTHGTYSNTEQQDLHFVKHTLKRWIEQFEQELNLKLFGWERHDRYVEFNVDGLLRGDFKTRMEGYAQGINNSVYTPAEVRERENLPNIDGSDQLLIQGATVPLGSQPTQGDSDET